MIALIRYVSLALVAVLTFSCATGGKKTSKIPERRAFPVSTKVNPCTDFFKYSCDGAIDSFQLRDDRSRHIFAFNDSAERVLLKKKAYLKVLQGMKPSDDRGRQLKAYYGSCVNVPARKKEELAYLAKIAGEVTPLKTKNALMAYSMKKGIAGENAHVGFGNIANLNNSDMYDFLVLPSRLASMPDRSYYKNKALIAEYKTLLAGFFKLMKMDKPDQRAQWVIDFETKYINMYPTPAERRQIWTMNKYATKAQLKSMAPNLQMDMLLAKVPKNVKIRNPMDTTFVAANAMIGKTPLEALKSVWLYQNLADVIDESYPEYFKKQFAFSHRHLGGPPVRTELTERCTQDVMSKFTKEIDAELFPQLFPNFPEKRFVALLEKVRGSIIKGLKNNKWLSASGKKNAILKVEKAKFQVVKPKTEKEWDFNPVATYSSSQYLANNLKLAKLLTDREFKRLPKPIDKTLWGMGPLTVNAYYSPTENKFVMPAGILQYPFYDPSLPDWVNLGAVGAVVGHELGHGVDDQGSKYDDKGKVKQWMTKADIATFGKRSEALIKQFDNAGHNGRLTLGENIGDLVGVTFALDAAKSVMPKDPAKRKLATQNFFRQYARAWCGVMRPKEKERLLKVDPHSLVWARVNEQMKHQPDFASAYNCKAGDKLVLPKEDVVRVW